MKPALTVTVRRLEAKELGVLQEHMPASRRFVGGVLQTYHETRLAAQEDGSAEYLIAWSDGLPVGHAFLRWNPDAPFLRERHLSDPLLEALAVRPDVQSRGVATAMMAEAERMTIERGRRALGLAVGIDNERARSLYARLGYRDAGVGEFSLSWTVADADGAESRRAETCTYLVKALR